MLGKIAVSKDWSFWQRDLDLICSYQNLDLLVVYT